MPDRKDKPPSEPVDRHAVQRNAREERLAKALRANLKRRKAAVRTAGTTVKPTGHDAPAEPEKAPGEFEQK